MAVAASAVLAVVTPTLAAAPPLSISLTTPTAPLTPGSVYNLQGSVTIACNTATNSPTITVSPGQEPSWITVTGLPENLPEPSPCVGDSGSVAFTAALHVSADAPAFFQSSLLVNAIHGADSTDGAVVVEAGFRPGVNLTLAGGTPSGQPGTRTSVAITVLNTGNGAENVSFTMSTQGGVVVDALSSVVVRSSDETPQESNSTTAYVSLTLPNSEGSGAILINALARSAENATIPLTASASLSIPTETTAGKLPIPAPSSLEALGSLALAAVLVAFVRRAGRSRLHRNGK
ncbi:MAG: hypothetical protein ACYDDF_05840 [Thermoplasmatota archaeon]